MTCSPTEHRGPTFPADRIAPSATASMQLLLEENPRAWRRFALQVCAVFAFVSAWLAWRSILSLPQWLGILAGLGMAALAAGLRPGWFRLPYRCGMIVSHWLGQHVGRILLTVIFFVAVLPLGLLLRAFGHDPLALRPRPGTASFWHPARPRSDLTRMH